MCAIVNERVVAGLNKWQLHSRQFGGSHIVGGLPDVIKLGFYSQWALVFICFLLVWSGVEKTVQFIHYVVGELNCYCIIMILSISS